MAQTRLKIVSNPYLGTIELQRWNGDWTKIDESTDPNSELLNSKLTTGFFPFKARDIVDAALRKFQFGNSCLTIVFEGSNDEFDELSAACAGDIANGIIALERSPRFLPNARDVLPEIIAAFKEIRPLIDESVIEKIANELEKFCDVSRDLIPLCILGNYSAGKSTFINALIGQELLPNGDEPVTARVYQIARSKQQDCATIKFSLGDTRIALSYDASGLVKDSNFPASALCDKIAQASMELGARGYAVHMNRALEILNRYKPENDGEDISDLIEIEIPFSQADSWGQSNEFVIFDTPGSNSASNAAHSRVLKKAMNGLSNGMPIYVAELDSLDSNDNAELYEEIRHIDAMDERFAMIVVNKADGAELPKHGFDEERRQEILDESVPRNLYAQGIYFVSSILGLGAKTGGEFVNDNYAEKYEDQERKYANPDNRFYKMLYRYNILPAQISARTIAESEECTNLVLANSGLYCVEREIDRFAERYSAYNKCQKSGALLSKVIDITSNEIETTKAQLEEERRNREMALDRDKQKLLEDLNAKGSEVSTASIKAYLKYMSSSVNSGKWKISERSLRDRESQLTRDKQAELGFDNRDKEAKSARDAVGDNLGARLSDALAQRNWESFTKAFSGLLDDMDEVRAKQLDLHKIGKEADS